MITKKIVAISLTGIILFAACGPRGKQAQLEKLEKQRDSLNERIARLKEDTGAKGRLNPNDEKATFVRLQRIEPTLFQHFIKVQGLVESDNNILIPAQASGLVKKIYIDTGSNVSRGQLLAELDGAIYESGIAELENSLDLAQTIFERQERLWEKKIGSEIEYLRAKNNKENLEKKLVTLKEQYRLTKIVSPIEGTVDDILIKEGEMAAAGRGVIRIVQLSKLKITAPVSENYISDIKKNDSVHIQIPIIGRDFELSITAVSRVIDPDNRTFIIEITIPSSEKGLKPNMLAVVIINDYTNPHALVVPQDIIQKTETQQFLFVAVEENGKWIARKRFIQTGKGYEDKVETTGGLESGDAVVTFGFQNLADGQLIAAEKS